MLYKLASTNCHTNVASSASKFLEDFLRSAKQKDGFESHHDQKIFEQVFSAL